MSVLKTAADVESVAGRVPASWSSPGRPTGGGARHTKGCIIIIALQYNR